MSVAVHERASSIISELTLADGTPVIVKKQRQTPNEPRPPGESARIEYDVLTRLRRDMTATIDGITYTVPAALELDETAASVTMTRASGKPLDRIVSTARRRRTLKALEAPLCQAGRWLRLMQQSTRSDRDGAPILETLIESAVRDLEGLPELREPVARVLRELEGPFPVTGQHGDLWAGNLFISDRSVEVIDFEGFRDGLPFEDAAYFLSYLELLPLAAWDYPRMERAFLDGWLEGQPVDRRTLELFKVMHAVRTLARMGNRNSLRERLVRGTLKKTITRSLR